MDGKELNLRCSLRGLNRTIIGFKYKYPSEVDSHVMSVLSCLLIKVYLEKGKKKKNVFSNITYSQNLTLLP